MATDDAQRFTSWKLDWIDALTIGAKGPELRIAVHLLQRCNAESGQLNPSIAYIAHMLDCDEKSVRRSIARLRAMGVLSATRRSRNDSYRYRFLDEWMQTTLEVEKRLGLEWKAKRLLSSGQI